MDNLLCLNFIGYISLNKQKVNKQWIFFLGDLFFVLVASNISELKDDVQSVLHSLSPQCLWASHDRKQIDLIHYEPLTLSLRCISFFFRQFPWVLQLWRLFIKWYQKEQSIKLCIDNGPWHETLNLLHVLSRCENLHFAKSYMKQNKSRKQTLESAQNGLEIIFTCNDQT